MINYTQLVVRTDKVIIKWLEQNGYENRNNLPDNYQFPVFIVDTVTKSIFGTNTTCMATSVTCGNKPIVLDFEQLKEKIRAIQS